jgi:hypothetical protein
MSRASPFMRFEESGGLISLLTIVLYSQKFREIHRSASVISKSSPSKSEPQSTQPPTSLRSDQPPAFGSLRKGTPTQNKKTRNPSILISRERDLSLGLRNKRSFLSLTSDTWITFHLPWKGRKGPKGHSGCLTGRDPTPYVAITYITPLS